MLRLVMTQSNLSLRGGAERVLLKIAQHYDAVIYTAEYDAESTFSEFKEIDVRVIRGWKPRLPYGRISQGLSYGTAFYTLDLKNDYDVINAHMAPAHWARRMNSRMLWYCHTPLRDIYDLYAYRQALRKPISRVLYAAGARAARFIDRRMVRRIETILANSANTEARIARYYGRHDAAVLNGGIDAERYSDCGDGRYFLYPSRISPNKRQEYAIEAFRIFCRIRKGYRLVICGPLSRDTFYRDYYRRILALARRTQGVRIMTGVGEKRLLRLYSRATAVLYPPVNEDYGLVPLEAMASGKPVIAMNEGGPRGTVVDGVTGFLVGNVAEMAARMEFVAAHPAAAQSMGGAGARHVRRHYGWGRFFKVFDSKARALARSE